MIGRVGRRYVGGKVRKAGVARDFVHGVAFVLVHEVGIFNFFANYVLPRPDVIEDDKGQSRQVRQPPRPKGRGL